MNKNNIFILFKLLILRKYIYNADQTFLNQDCLSISYKKSFKNLKQCIKIVNWLLVLVETHSLL